MTYIIYKCYGFTKKRKTLKKERLRGKNDTKNPTIPLKHKRAIQNDIRTETTGEKQSIPLQMP